ncbi:MAG: TonB-dependent receptor plug domain-containing protein, partial [Gemmatimonadales bacterium]
YVLVVRRLGFAPSSSVLQVAGGDTLRMSFALERIVNALDTVVVAEKQLSPRLTEFEDRRKAGFGHFVTQAEIDKRNPVYTADLLRVMPSVNVVSPARGGHVAVNFRGRCAFKIFLDGIVFPSTNLDDLPSPRELAGIEVYSGPSTIPFQYKSISGSTCGVILVWTRDGS